MALARDRGGALAALLATPPVGFDAGRRSDGSDKLSDELPDELPDGSDWDEDVGGGYIPGIPSMDSALVDALGPDGRDVAALGNLVARLRAATGR